MKIISDGYLVQHNLHIHWGMDTILPVYYFRIILFNGNMIVEKKSGLISFHLSLSSIFVLFLCGVVVNISWSDLIFCFFVSNVGSSTTLSANEF